MTDEQMELVVAEEYAIASILYYDLAVPCTGVSDGQFDTWCDWLRRRGADARIPWLDPEMLQAGSGYETAEFPRYLHEEAWWRTMELCQCVNCLADRGEIVDPEVLRRMGR